MKLEKLKLASAKAALGLIIAEDLVGAAVDALEDGCDSPSLRILAGLTEEEIDEAWPLFNRALVELKVLTPVKRDALKSLARESAKSILSRTTAPYQGARQIWELSLRLPEEHLSELDSFIYAASEWEDRPEDRQAFEEGILKAAEELLSGEKVEPTAG